MAVAIVAATALACGMGTGALIPLLRRRNVLDRPNDRSSHAVPTPRGGGIAVIGIVLLVWLDLAAAGWVTMAVVPIAIAAGLLAVVCWIDDLHDLPPLIRLAAQAAVVAIGLFALPETGSGEMGWLGSVAYFTALGLLWMWWVNLYNFMDGIDGIAGSEAAAIAAGLLLFAMIGSGVDLTVALLAAPILGASLGFLFWNWSPARIFLGDVGSVPLGYLTGYLLIGLAAVGRWKIALILPLFFLADATITLGRRLLRGERIWEAHRQHFYQQAVRRGIGHAAVVKRVIVGNLALIACGWAAENGEGALAVGAAVVVVAALLTALARGGPSNGAAELVSRPLSLSPAAGPPYTEAMAVSSNNIRRALISVSDKTGITDFAAALVARGVTLVSTGGSAQALRAAGSPRQRGVGRHRYGRVFGWTRKNVTPGDLWRVAGASRSTGSFSRPGRARDRPHRSVGVQPLSICSDGCWGRWPRRLYRKHRYRRGGVDPRWGKEPRGGNRHNRSQ